MFLIELKQKITINLNILKKYNIICILLVNTTMYLNSIKKPNVPKFYRKKKKISYKLVYNPQMTYILSYTLHNIIDCNHMINV